MPIPQSGLCTVTVYILVNQPSSPTPLTQQWCRNTVVTHANNYSASYQMIHLQASKPLELTVLRWFHSSPPFHHVSYSRQRSNHPVRLLVPTTENVNALLKYKNVIYCLRLIHARFEVCCKLRCDNLHNTNTQAHVWNWTNLNTTKLYNIPSLFNFFTNE